MSQTCKHRKYHWTDDDKRGTRCDRPQKIGAFCRTHAVYYGHEMVREYDKLWAENLALAREQNDHLVGQRLIDRTRELATMREKCEGLEEIAEAARTWLDYDGPGEIEIDLLNDLRARVYAARSGESESDSKPPIPHGVCADETEDGS